MSATLSASVFPPDVLAFALAWPAHVPDLGGWASAVEATEDGAEYLVLNTPTGGVFLIDLTAEGLVAVAWRAFEGGLERREVYDDLRGALQAIRPMTPRALSAVENDAAGRMATL